MEALQKLFKSKFKQQALDGDSKYAKMNLEDSNPNNLPPPLKICALTIAQVKDFRVSLFQMESNIRQLVYINDSNLLRTEFCDHEYIFRQTFQSSHAFVTLV